MPYDDKDMKDPRAGVETSKLSNTYVAKMFREIAAAYEIKGENRFKIRAYDTVADSVEHATSEVKDLWEEGRLDELPGIGETIGQHIDEYFKTGKVKHFEEIKKGLPPGMFELMGLEGVGPKTAFRLAKELKVNNVDELFEALKAGKISKLPGFGKRSEDLILKAVEGRKEGGERILLPVAFSIAEKIIEELKRLPGVKEALPLGSLRRMVATVGDIDIGVATDKPKDVVSAFTNLPDVERVLGAGGAKASVVLKTGRQIDIRVHDPKSFGALLQYFTGSKQHNIHLRKIANAKGLSLSEYGVKKYEGGKIVGEYLPTSTEEEFYKLLGMPMIPPEIREDTGEIEAAQKGTLPQLVVIEDVKGEIHSHTTHSDGEEPTVEMVQAAVDLKRQYLGISDHAPSVETRSVAEAKKEILMRKHEIEKLKQQFKGKIELFFGAEVNIDTKGQMALPDELLALYEYVIASIHTSFNQPKEMITKRILNALENPYVNLIAHPTGRLLGEREAYEVDWEKVFAAAVGNGKFLEINSYPSRLDLPDDLVKIAKSKGVRFVINTDSHHRDHFKNLRFGVSVARRGWCEKKDIANTAPAAEFAKLFKVRR